MNIHEGLNSDKTYTISTKACRVLAHLAYFFPAHEIMVLILNMPKAIL